MKIVNKNLIYWISLTFILIIIFASMFMLITRSSQDEIRNSAQLNNVGYLGESKLFLVSANVSYGVYSASAPWSGGTFDDQDCFVITATIRNDYTVEELQALDNSIYPTGHPGKAHFFCECYAL